VLGEKTLLNRSEFNENQQRVSHTLFVTQMNCYQYVQYLLTDLGKIRYRVSPQSAVQYYEIHENLNSENHTSVKKVNKMLSVSSTFSAYLGNIR
jgi:hypothetical protein